ncbi:hypothetical protein M8C21_003390 [Ambrosia artemisiifolia]|uniref:Uncharacterized protein n=1 Tax=Ambrosia artemisiifolia TaxID=4212 RepID=A0AAD5C4H2_AMBAR|nr:hypothetical protein M8C21_003390 [Ambrosia artemisiifolia]
MALRPNSSSLMALKTVDEHNKKHGSYFLNEHNKRQVDYRHVQKLFLFFSSRDSNHKQWVVHLISKFWLRS